MGRLLQGQYWSPRPLYRAWGHREYVTLKNPAAAHNFAFVIPPPFIWVPRMLRFHVAVAAGAKEVSAVVKFVGDGGNATAISAHSTNTIEGVPRTYMFNAQYTCAPFSADGFTIAALITEPLHPGDEIVSEVSPLETTDAITEISLYAECFETEPTHDLERLEEMARRVEDLERRLT